MMKLLMVMVLSILLLGGCSKKTEHPVIVVDDIVVSLAEFNNAYQSSIFSRIEGGGKKDFLETFISRKLILKQAEKMNLDKDPEFLNDIQLFWEQSLLKRVLLHQTQQISEDLVVAEKDIEAFYQQHQGKELQGKEYVSVKEDIRNLLFQQKQQELITKWINQLRRDARVTIDYPSLGINPGP
jgi:hypothetical protein